MDGDYSLELHTDRDLAKARRRGKMVGWAQGGTVTFAALLGYNMFGWLPTILILAVVAFGIFKLAKRPKRSDPLDEF